MNLDFIKEEIEKLLLNGEISIENLVVMLAEIIKENNII